MNEYIGENVHPCLHADHEYEDCTISANTRVDEMIDTLLSIALCIRSGV